MSAFAVPRYLAQTTRRDEGVRGWISDLPALAGRDRAVPGLPETADSQVLLCTYRHGVNVLAAQRAPWLMIDPKPYLGDPAYDVLQRMLNCEDRLRLAAIRPDWRRGWPTCPGWTPAGLVPGQHVELESGGNDCR